MSKMRLYSSAMDARRCFCAIMVTRNFPTSGLKEYSSIQIRRLMSRELKDPAAVIPASVPAAAPSTTDWHHLEQHKFVRAVSAALEKLVREQDVKALIIAAPPRTLADLRHDLHDDVKARLIAEVGKDLTKQPLYEIEKHLTG